ncbi:MAG: flavin reductase family protein [Eubacteriales bacterium]|nr:flavin reductase family protein [Eubacteriales bacterium]
MTISDIQKNNPVNPFALITTTKPDGTTNLAAVSWWTFACNRPPMVLICVSKKGYTGELIQNTKEFVLNTVDETLAQAAFACGTCTGRDTDKAGEFNIELESIGQMQTKCVKHHCYALACKMEAVYEAGDHLVFAGNVVDMKSRENVRQLYAAQGYAKLVPVAKPE